MRTPPVVLFAVLAACTSRVELGAQISVDDTTESVLVALVYGREVEVHARPVSGGAVRYPALRLDGEGDVELVAMLYDETLEELEIQPGPVPLVVAPELGREIPAFRSARRAVISGTELGSFTELVALDGVLAEVRLAPPDRNGCLAAGGCYPGQVSCVIPCPQAPSPADIEDPAEAAAPQLDALAEAAPPAPPVLECPPGWSSVTPRDGDGVPTCEPVQLTCAEHEMVVPGDAGCAAIAGDCPAGDYASALPPNTLYVRAGAVGGDGSITAPFGTIAAALAAAAPGDTLALAKGIYREAVDLPQDVTLRGACRETELAPLAANGGAAITTSAGGAAVVGLRVRAPGHGIEVLAGGSLSVRDVELESDAYGLRVVGSNLDVDRVRVRAEAGLSIEPGSTVTAARILVEGFTITGVTSVDSFLSLSDSVIRDAAATGANAGIGTLVRGGAANVERSVFEHNQHAGLRVDTGATATIADALIRSTRSVTDTSAGVLAVEATLAVRNVHLTHNTRGLHLDRARAVLEDVVVEHMVASPASHQGSAPAVIVSSTVTARRMLLRDGHGYNLVVERSTFEAEDLRATDLVPAELEGAPSCLAVTDRSRAVLDRVGVERCLGSGIAASRGAYIELEDFTAAFGLAPDPDRHDLALSVLDGSTAHLERVRVEGVFDTALLASDPGTVLTATSVRVTGARPAGEFGITALLVQDDARARLARADIGDCLGSTLLARDRGVLEIEDTIVRSNGANEAFGVGFGVQIARTSRARLTRVRVEGSVASGIAISEGSSAALEDVSILDTVAQPDGRPTAGLGIAEGVDIVLRRVEVLRSAGVGVLASASAGTHDFADLTIRDVAFDGAAEATGVGLAVHGAAVRAERLAISGTAQAGVSVAGKSNLDAAGVQVSGAGSDGLEVMGMSAVMLDGAVVRDSVRAGLRVEGLGTQIGGTSVVVAGGSNTGVLSVNGGLADLSIFRVDGNAGSGVRLERGRGQLRSGAITSNGIGLSITDASIDVKALLDGVQLSGNAVHLQVD